MATEAKLYHLGKLWERLGRPTTPWQRASWARRSDAEIAALEAGLRAHVAGDCDGSCNWPRCKARLRVMQRVHGQAPSKPSQGRPGIRRPTARDGAGGRQAPAAVQPLGRPIDARVAELKRQRRRRTGRAPDLEQLQGWYRQPPVV